MAICELLLLGEYFWFFPFFPEARVQEKQAKTAFVSLLLSLLATFDDKT
jgi:hypothetical protein